MALNAIVQRTREFITGRAGSYRRTFNLQDRDNEAVLTDLARFCRAHESTAHKDPIVAARLDGRREVWLRIQQHLKLDDETLWLLYGGPNIAKGE